MPPPETLVLAAPLAVMPKTKQKKRGKIIPCPKRSQDLHAWYLRDPTTLVMFTKEKLPLATAPE